MSELIQKENANRFVHLLLDIGEGMLCSGAEINRVEETIAKTAAAYGVKQTNAFVIPSLITLTLDIDDDFQLTQSRRIVNKSITTNLARLCMLSRIAHECRENPLPLDELEGKIRACNRPVPFLRFYIGSAIAAGSLSIFFGGSIWDGLVALLLAIVICFFQNIVARVIANKFVLSFLCAFFIGVAAGGMGLAIGALHVDKILIGDIMLLIPGIAVTVSARDIILGDTISGSVRLIDSLFITLALAFGFWLAQWVIG